MINHRVERRLKDLEVFYKTKIPKSIIHMHDVNELFLLTEGKMNYLINGEFQQVEKGDLIFIKENQIHGPMPTTSNQVSRSYIHFSTKIAKKVSDHETNIMDLYNQVLGIKRLTPKQFEDVKSLLLKMNYEYQNPSTFGHNILLESYLAELLLYTINSIDNQHENIPLKNSSSIISVITKETANYILDQLSNPGLSLELIAEELSYNKSYLNRIFKKEIGTTIYQYIIINRVSKAKEYMTQGITPQECAFSCGFNNYSSFYRTFRKQTGLSPSDYIKYYCD